jgi:hypothetical protein
MITEEQLKALYNECAAKVSGITTEAVRQKNEVRKPFDEMLEQYYDEKIIDVAGRPMQVGMLIKHVKTGRQYKVIDRGMQFVLGELMFNNHVTCLKQIFHP